jgi:hypothetical protein
MSSIISYKINTLTLILTAHGLKDPFLIKTEIGPGWRSKIFIKKIKNASQNISANFFVKGFSIKMSQ